MPDSFEAVVVASDGLPLAGASVRIRPEHWTANAGVAPSSWETRTEKDGSFEIPWPDTGRWSLEILANSVQEGRFLPSVDDSLLRASTPRMILAPLAALSGRVPVASSESRGAVLLEGTDREVLPDPGGSWSFDDLGPGSYRVLWSRPGGDTLLRDRVFLGPSDTVRLDSTPSSVEPLILTGRLASVVSWDPSPLPIAGWSVSITGDSASAATNANGEFRLPTSERGRMRIVATHAATGQRVDWDTVVAADATGLMRLAPRAAKTAADTFTYEFLSVANPDRIRRPLRVRVAADTTALSSTGMPGSDRARLPAMLGWTDDSGRFALRREHLEAFHATLEDSIDGIGAVFPWGKGTPPESLPPIHIGSPGSARLAMRFPPGTSSQVTVGGILVSSMGTPILATAVLAGQPASFPSLYPGRHRFAVVSLQTARPIAGWVEATVSEGAATVVDTLLTQEQVEDTADWPEATLLSIQAPTGTHTLRQITLRLDLADVLDLASYPPSDLGLSLRFHDESGRWVPAVATRWIASEGIATFAVLLDSLPPDGRSLIVRHGLSKASMGGYAMPRFVFRREAGYLAHFAGGTTDPIPPRRVLQAEGLVYVPGREYTQSFRFDPSTRAKVAIPADSLGTDFGIQMVVGLEAAAPDSETLLSFRVLPGGEEVAALGTRGERSVLVVRDSTSGPRAIELPGFAIPRGTRCVLGMRRRGDSLEVRVVSGSDVARRSLALAWPAGTDSIEFVAGANPDGTAGFAGTVDAISIHDGSWTTEREDFEAAWWTPGAHAVRKTPLR